MSRSSLSRVIAVIFATAIAAVSSPSFAASNASVAPDSIDAGTGVWLTVTADVAASANVSIALVADFDGDGVQDPIDFVYRYYQLREGVAPLVAASPAPGDEDAVAGHITANLDFWQQPVPVGHFIVIVNDGAGPSQDTLTVNPVVTGQSISGVLQDEGGAAIPGIVQLANSTETSEWMVATDASGAYTAFMPTGDYYAAGVAPGWLSDFEGGSAVQFHLNAGQSLVDQDLTLFEGDTTLGGRIVDSSTAQGVPFLLVTLETDEASDSDMMSLAVTDAAGYYSFPVTAEDWEVWVEDTNYRALVGLNVVSPVTVGATPVNDVNFTFAPATTYISGSVKRQDNNAPLSSYNVWARTPDGGGGTETWTYRAGVDAHTHGDGGFTIFTPAGNWFVEVDEDDCRRDGFMRPAGRSVSPAAGVPVTGVDFLLRQPTAQIDVHVKDADSNNPVTFLGVWVNDIGFNNVGYQETDENGDASIGVTAGFYRVGLDQNGVAARGYLSPNNAEVTLADGQSTSIVFALTQANASIGGHLSHLGAPVGNIDVWLYRTTPTREFAGSVRANAIGDYDIPVAAGDYEVQPSGRDLVSRGIAPVSPTAVSVGVGGHQIVNFDLPSPNATLNIQIDSLGVPQAGVMTFVEDAQGKGLTDMLTNSSGTATIGLLAGSYFVGVPGENARAAGLIPEPGQNVTLGVGANVTATFDLLPLASRTALDFLLGQLPLTIDQAAELNRTGDGLLDIGDVLGLIGQGH